MEMLEKRVVEHLEEGQSHDPPRKRAPSLMADLLLYRHLQNFENQKKGNPRTTAL